MPMENELHLLPSLRCSFCEKEQSAVRQLVVGPRAACICDECIRICQAAIREKTWLGRLQAGWQLVRRQLSFSLLEKQEWQWVLVVMILVLQLITLSKS